MRCPFCGAVYSGDTPRKKVGVHTLICESCGRAFILHIQKRWWGYQRSVHIR